jgi:2-hydroxycyclohexanecarboxyl-CoA dehydrogenase
MTWTAPSPDSIKGLLTEGPLTGDDRPMLEAYLRWQRATLLSICSGLTAEQLASRPLPSSNLSLLGLVRHLAKVERIWLRIRAAGEPIEPMYHLALGKDYDFEDIDPARAEEVAAAIGADAIALPGDVGSEEDVTRIVAALVDAFGPVDVLVNNAALATYEATIRHFLETDAAGWKRIIQTNLTSVYLCSHAVAMSMAKRRTGAIINLSSGGASKAHRAMPSYDAAKGGIEALTRSMALDLAPYGVRVNFVVPGLIRTYDISDELAEERGQVVPLQRLGTADDMAGPIVFLASDDARYMTGSGVVVDGGVLVQQRSAPVDIFPVSQYPDVPAET